MTIEQLEQAITMEVEDQTCKNQITPEITGSMEEEIQEEEEEDILVEGLEVEMIMDQEEDNRIEITVEAARHLEVAIREAMVHMEQEGVIFHGHPQLLLHVGEQGHLRAVMVLEGVVHLYLVVDRVRATAVSKAHLIGVEVGQAHRDHQFSVNHQI